MIRVLLGLISAAAVLGAAVFGGVTVTMSDSYPDGGSAVGGLPTRWSSCGAP